MTQEQKDHNRWLDFEIEQAQREFDHREELARLKNEWFCNTFPNASESSKRTFGINMTSKRIIIGIRYVD